MPTSHTTGNLTFEKPPTDTDAGVPLTARTISRVIGVKGSGVARITGEVRRRFPDSGPYIRADRGSNIFQLSTRGHDADAALLLLANKVKAEIAWIAGHSEDCPHPKTDIDEPEDKEIIKHIIGQRGNNLRELSGRVSRGEHGHGCFIVHKPDLGVFRVEGVSQAQVDLGVRRLQQLIAKIILDQTPKVLDLEGVDTTAAAAAAAAAAAPSGDTNSFDALASSSDDDDDGDDETTDRFQEDVVRSLHTTTSKAAGIARISLNRRFNAHKTIVSTKLGIGFHQVADRLVQESMRAEDLANEGRVHTAALHAQYDTSSTTEFPSASGTDSEHIKLKVAPATCWSQGAGGAAAASSDPVKPPLAPPMPKPGSMVRTYTCDIGAATDMPPTPAVSPLCRSTTHDRSWGSDSDDDE
jgi:hypothetical protein